MYHGFGKFIRGKGFSILFYLVSVLLMFYLTVKIGSVAEYVFSVDIYSAVFVVLAVLMFYMLCYFSSKKAEKRAKNLYEVCGVVLCVLLNLTMCFLVFDFLNIFVPFEKAGWCLIPTAAGVLLSAYGFFHARHLTVKKYQIQLGEKKLNKRLVLLSDIHTGSFVNEKHLEKIIEKVNELNADLIFIAGDTFDVKAFECCNLPKLEEIFRRLRSKEGVYASLGNHDPLSSEKNVREFFEKSGICLLTDKCAETQDFYIIGRENVTSCPDRKSLAEILPKKRGRKPEILLEHNPGGIEEAIENKVTLVLCGHTHKGQFFPATFFTRLAYGKKDFYGYAKREETQSIVSAGTGYFQMPMRIGSNSEIVLIEV